MPTVALPKAVPEVDGYGGILRIASAAYGRRRYSDADLYPLLPDSARSDR